MKDARSKVEQPGAALATAAMVDRVLSTTGHAIHELVHLLSAMEDEGNSVKALRLKPQGGVKGEWLAVITVSTPEGGIVAFHSGAALPSTIEGLRNRLRNGSLKWKDDEYA